MKGIKDYSGEYRPDAKFEDFSVDTLAKLLRNYQRIFVGLMGMWNTVNRERLGVEAARELDSIVYERQIKQFEIPLVQEAMNLYGDDVVTMLKYFQMCPDGAREGLFKFDFDIKNRNHAIGTCTYCASLFYLERRKDDKGIEALCGPGGVEDRAFTAICKYFNPNMTCKALELPPRKSKDATCCVWEFKVEPKT